MTMTNDAPLRILHAVRAPVGGIFRHILDVANGQVERGHQVGILADSMTGGERAAAALAEIAPRLALGVHRLPICREPQPRDLISFLRFRSLVNALEPNVLHGHGAQAGAFVRMKKSRPDLIKIYTPHGGSLHYSQSTLKGKVFSQLERMLMNHTDLFLFESQFARDTYLRVVGQPQGLVRTVFNGVTGEEFEPLQTAPDATDLTYVGEFRHIKGADLLVDAVAELRRSGRPVTLTLAGDGEETAALKAQIERLQLGDAVRFIGHVQPRVGFAQGRLLVVPSRGDSMPYVVIEAAAAAKPMIAAKIGGIPEIFGPYADGLFPGKDAGAMASAIAAALDNPVATFERAKQMQARIAEHFSQMAMVDGVLAGYREAFARR
ncbi:MAG TPA: glycosyltransferase family 4 protein [Xanthobacteraceae bacterium]|nr:glycosyltransferase family 4 protein [Xanthobacteraceae bacterium]